MKIAQDWVFYKEGGEKKENLSVLDSDPVKAATRVAAALHTGENDFTDVDSLNGKPFVIRVRSEDGKVTKEKWSLPND